MSIYLIEFKFSFSNGTMSHTIEAKQLKEFKPYRLVQVLHLRKSVSQFVREFQSPPLGPSCPLSLFKILPSFLFHPLLRYFRQSPPPSRDLLLPYSNTQTFLTHLHIINRFKKYQKGDFTISKALLSIKNQIKCKFFYNYSINLIDSTLFSIFQIPTAPR